LERDLAKYSLLGEQQVRRAAELARLTVRADDELRDEPATHREQLDAERERVIKRAVAHSQKVLGRDRTEGLRDSVTSYDLDLLNIAGRFTPRQIIAALSERPTGSLCFWGIPGAGKTQLAEHIAVELDLPILMRSASELLSMWLGETEQQISKMFAEAQNEGALLFLDEADSFLRDRTLARAHWEVTQVNELLQRMERFEGIFIAATNLMDSIDAAAMRRFTWKLEFKALRHEQAWSMFCTESGFDPNTEPERAEEFRQALDAIDDLAPGDFATVKRQAQVLGEKLSPEAWIEQLAAEAKAKMLGLRRQQLGFAS
jgi:SpoVK/Ycf46/Vps4 family AAA+-type ATPase